ncbi:MAG: alpha-1,4-glucan branching enzyme [Chaenotheca gracillima]|nr:MAG: alpha-1,4-glucan branching enzyme [Chaenotheca gracillima]
MEKDEGPYGTAYGSKMEEDVHRGEVVEDLELHNTKTHRGLKSRHSQMLALGGTIGTGLFVGSGAALARGGPAFILIGYIVITILILGVVTAITEVATYLPVSGGTMGYFGNRYASSSLGFAMGWLYWYSLGILVPYEITAAGLVIDYWNSPINIAVWITIFIIVIVALNFLPVKYYGESEFWFASLKVFLLIGLLLLSFILFWGGGPNHQRLGFHYWKDPGATNSWLVPGGTGTFVAFLSTFVLSSFPFAFAPELLVVTAGEMQAPRRNLPKASKRYFYRLVIFYVGSVLAIGVICPSNDPALTSGGAGAKASPFVVGIKNAGIVGLDSVVNAAIITSAWSSGNSFLYISSRSIYSLAVAGNAPAIFKTCNRWGVPYYAVGFSSLFTALAYLNCANSGSTVFTWFVNLTNTSSYISWMCCCIVYLRFNKACKRQGLTDLPYHSFLQPYLAYVSLVGFAILLLINGFDVFFPGRFSASAFLTAYVGIPAFLVIYFGHRIYHYKDPWLRHPETVDLQSNLEEILALDDHVVDRSGMPWWKRLNFIWE